MKACVGLWVVLLVGQSQLFGHLFVVHELYSPNHAQRLFLYGDYHSKISDKITALEHEQLLALLSACKSYQKSTSSLVLFAEDPVRTYGYRDCILDRGQGLLPGLLNQLDTYKIPALTTINIETRKVLLAALQLFDYTRFPMLCIDCAEEVKEQRRLDVTKFTMGQLFDEMEQRLMAIIEKCSGFDTQRKAVNELIGGALTAYYTLYHRMMGGTEKAAASTTLLAYAIDLACKDVACSSVVGGRISLVDDLQKEALALVDDYPTLSLNAYRQRLVGLSEMWQKEHGLGVSRRHIWESLAAVGDALVELEALCCVLQARRDATTIVVLAGGDHVQSLQRLFIARGFENKGSKELAYKQALDPSIFDALHQSRF